MCLCMHSIPHHIYLHWNYSESNFYAYIDISYWENIKSEKGHCDDILPIIKIYLPLFHRFFLIIMNIWSFLSTPPFLSLNSAILVKQKRNPTYIWIMLTLVVIEKSFFHVNIFVIIFILHFYLFYIFIFIYFIFYLFHFYLFYILLYCFVYEVMIIIIIMDFLLAIKIFIILVIVFYQNYEENYKISCRKYLYIWL